MNLEQILCINRYPKIDLHGYDRETARVAINDFVKEQHKLKQKYILIIHGIGSGILKEATFNTLKLNHLVLNYQIVYNNVGCTIVALKN